MPTVISLDSKQHGFSQSISHSIRVLSAILCLLKRAYHLGEISRRTIEAVRSQYRRLLQVLGSLGTVQSNTDDFFVAAVDQSRLVPLALKPEGYYGS